MKLTARERAEQRASITTRLSSIRASIPEDDFMVLSGDYDPTDITDRWEGTLAKAWALGYHAGATAGS